MCGRASLKGSEARPRAACLGEEGLGTGEGLGQKGSLLFLSGYFDHVLILLKKKKGKRKMTF